MLPECWTLSFEEIDDAPSEAWRDFARPMRITHRLIVTPAWCEVDDAGGALVIPIEPGGSFGLGDHPTTRLSASLVDRLVRPGDRVVDVGCGSGVLGIIAALRGAVEVIGVDIAEAAVEATQANARRNAVDHLVTSSSSHPVHVDGQFDLVVANILAPTLIELSPELRRLTAPAGALVISGVLADHHDHVVVALEPMEVETTEQLDGWAAVVLRHPSIGR
jgi:ribosomal protein L11 methyltransferase